MTTADGRLGADSASLSCTVRIRDLPHPSLLIDKATSVILDRNEAALDLLQLGRAPLIGDRFDLLLHRFAHPSQDIVQGDNSPRLLIVMPNGTESVFTYVSTTAVQAGRAVDIVMLIDVTERDRRTGQLKQERSFLERVVQTIPAAIFVKDGWEQSRYVLCTSFTEDLAKLDRGTLLGAVDADVFDATTAEDYFRSDQHVLASQALMVSEATVCMPDGRLLFTETKKMPIVEPTGSPRYVLGITEDITARREMELRLARLAMRDSLTGLANRTLFREKLRAALVQRQQIGGFLVLHCLDLDHFKSVNDILGHAAGDELLVEVAARMEAICSPRETIARLGGDEFAVIQGPIASLDEATNLASRMSRTLNRPIEIEGRPMMIGSSAGLAVAPEHGDDSDTLLRSADIALYGSKEEGRGSYRFFDSELATKFKLRNCMEEDVREALALRSFELFYQPILDIAADEVAGYEALLRWNHPVRGAVPPSVIIPLAEQNGLMLPLGEWILFEACREAATWPSGRISVNLSSVQFRSPGLAATVEAALTRTGLAPGRLELEITESVLLADSRANLDTLHQLRDLGVRISLDDFGTGYSSLGYLNAFPFNKIKIDRSLVRDIGSTTSGFAIVRSIIKLAQDLGMTTTAEGVETSEQLEILRREECTEAQGFLFAAAQPASAIQAREPERILSAQAA